MLEIDFKKIYDIHGSAVLDQIRDNLDIVNQNIRYLSSLEIESIEEIFEMYAPAFILDCNEFAEKVQKLIIKLGSNYQEKIAEDLFWLEELL